MSESRVLSKFTLCMTHVPDSAFDDLLYHRFIASKKKTNEHDYLTCECLVERGQWWTTGKPLLTLHNFSTFTVDKLLFKKYLT